MSKMIDAYHKIIDELEEKVDDKEVVLSLKLQIQELLLEIISKARNDNEELSERQEIMRDELSEIKRKLSRIEKDIYFDEDDQEDDDDDSDYYAEDCDCCDCCDEKCSDDYEFQVKCPYCKYKFIVSEQDKIENSNEIECPNCNRSISIDWGDTECSGHCDSCNSHLIDDERAQLTDDEIRDLEMDSYDPEEEELLKQEHYHVDDDDDDYDEEFVKDNEDEYKATSDKKKKSKNKKDKQENDKPQSENKHDDNDEDM